MQGSGYPWVGGTPQQYYVNLLNQIVPESDTRVTVEWICFAKELAEAAETSFEREANDLITAFRNLKESFPAEIVSGIYQLIDTQHSALLPNELALAAEALQNGVPTEDVIKMADSGQFESGMMPVMTLQLPCRGISLSRLG